MSLADEIAAHRVTILADLDAAHDYFVNSKYAWDFLLREANAGGKVRIRNRLTRNITTESQLPGKVQGYIKNNLTTATLQQFVSLLEDFVFGLIRLWLLQYPASLSRKQIPVSAVLEATDLEALKLLAVTRELNELSYRKVREWFTYLQGLTKLEGPSIADIDQLAEIKATRDIHVHNRGIANALYVEKAGVLKRCEAGERLPLPQKYHIAAWDLIRKVVEDVSTFALQKTAIASSETPRSEDFE